MTKPIKPSKSLIYCYACKRRKMLFREQSEADNFIKYNHGGILEENGKAPVRSYYCELCCGYHVTSNPSVEDGERRNRQDAQLLQELVSMAQAMDKFKELGHVLGSRIQDSKDQMFIGSFQEINDLHKELLPYRALLEKLPLEEKARFATHFRRADFLYAVASKMEELVSVPDSELENYVSREFPAISEENFKIIEMMVKLRKMEQSIREMSSYPDAVSREDYKLKVEEIGRYLASIRPIVGRKVTASYRRKLGLCS
jgi:hypothetical protein